jgi:hypothetical protein
MIKMKIKEITSQIRRDFNAIYECENCGHTQKGYGYDDRNFHNNVMPEMKCKECGKSRNDLGIEGKITQTKRFNIKVTVLREGQPSPYADNEFECEIETTGFITPHSIKRFCTEILAQCSQTKAKWNKDNLDSYFAGYYEFSKIKDNKYRYYVKKPYTG